MVSWTKKWCESLAVLLQNACGRWGKGVEPIVGSKRDAQEKLLLCSLKSFDCDGTDSGKNCVYWVEMR